MNFQEFRKAMGPMWSPLFLISIIFFLLLPHFVNDYIRHLFIMIFLFAFLGLAWDLCGGQAGLFSIGHAGFLGVVAYTSTVLFTKAGLSPWLGMLAGGFLAVGFSLVLGYLSFRYGLIGAFFALATIAFGEILRIAVDNIAFLNGARGILVPFKGNSIWFFQFDTKLPFYYISLGLLLFMMVFNGMIQRSKVGYCFYAIREDEDATNALGINPMRYKLIAIAISAFFTAWGGTFYAQYLMFIQPSSVLSIPMSVEIITRPIIGGMGTLLGPLLGSFLVGGLTEITRLVFGSVGKAGVHLVVYGILIILVVRFVPSGLAPWVENLWAKYRASTSAGIGEGHGAT